jgi:hypothetical protein
MQHAQYVKSVVDNWKSIFATDTGQLLIWKLFLSDIFWIRNIEIEANITRL